MVLKILQSLIFSHKHSKNKQKHHGCKAAVNINTLDSSSRVNSLGRILLFLLHYLNCIIIELFMFSCESVLLFCLFCSVFMCQNHRIKTNTQKTDRVKVTYLLYDRRIPSAATLTSPGLLCGERRWRNAPFPAPFPAGCIAISLSVSFRCCVQRSWVKLLTCLISNCILFTTKCTILYFIWLFCMIYKSRINHQITPLRTFRALLSVELKPQFETPVWSLVNIYIVH